MCWKRQKSLCSGGDLGGRFCDLCHPRYLAGPAARLSGMGIVPFSSAKRSYSTFRAKNRLLSALPDDEWKRLEGAAKHVPAVLRQCLYHAGEPLTHVYFPLGGVFSITTPLPEGTMVEAATVGQEGMLGIEALFSSSPIAPGQAFLQVASDDGVIQVAVDPFRDELARQASLHNVVSAYAQTLFAQMMQAGACNAIHSLRQRYARWLLMAHDRMGSDSFYLSQEFLAVTLGVQRPSITRVASAFQRAGFIRYVHGRIRILDRRQLEAAACSCYASIRVPQVTLDALS